MSDNEDLRHSVTEIMNKTGQAWREQVAHTFEEVALMQTGLQSIDAYIGQLIPWVTDTIETHYAEEAAYDIQAGSEFLKKKHAALSQVLEGTTNSDALTGLQKLAEAHESSVDMLVNIRDTSEAVSANLTAKIEAIRKLIQTIRSQVYVPFVAPDDVGRIAHALAHPSEDTPTFGIDPEVGRHISASFMELEIYKEEL